MNRWLTDNDYQPLAANSEVVSFYTQLKYVFVCIKVDRAARGQAPVGPAAVSGYDHEARTSARRAPDDEALTPSR